MAEEFDPYRKWLGIPPDEQPANHYRLLGIALFEDDPDVIQNAADRQMKHVRTFQTGRHGPLSQRLLNELSAAKVCLLTDKDKAAYDDALRAEIAAREMAARAAALPAPPPPGAPQWAEPPAAPPPPPPEPILVGPPVVSTRPRIQVPSGTKAAAPVVVAGNRPVAIDPVPSAPAPGEDFPASVRASASPRLRGDRGSAWPMILGLGGLVGIGLVILLVLMAGGFGGATKPGDAAGDTPAKRVEPAPPRPAPRPARPTEPSKAGSTNVPPGGLQPPPPSGPNLDTELALAREALGRRDRDAAQRHLIDAAQAAGSDAAAKAKVEQLQALAVYLGEFWKGVRRGVFQTPLEGDEATFTYRDQRYRLLRREGDEIVYEVDGREKRTRVDDLPARDAVAFARSPRGLPANDPWTDIFVATFYHFDRIDAVDLDQRRRIADRLWRQAKDAGLANVFLARELGIERDLPADADLHPQVPEDFGTNPPIASAKPPLPAPPMTQPMPNPPPLTPPGAAMGRAERPSASEETAALERVRRTYDAALAKAKTDDEALVALVKLLYTDAKKEQDPAPRLARLSLAADLALQAARIEAGLLIVEEMADQFQINAMHEKLARLSKLKLPTLPTERVQLVAQFAAGLFDEAVSRRDYVAAQDAGVLVLAASKTAGDGPGERRGRELQEAVRELVTEQKAAEPRAKMLEQMPDDPTSNFLVGKFKCWGELDWAGGLPLLAKGNDKELADLAAAELAVPGTADEKLKLAEAWFSYGRRRKGLAGEHILAHARVWFEQVAAQGEAATRQAAEKRLKEIRDLPPAVPAPVPVAMP